MLAQRAPEVRLELPVAAHPGAGGDPVDAVEAYQHACRIAAGVTQVRGPLDSSAVVSWR
jgi:hypothetical protein